jgi:hypothetical protein
VGLPQARKAHKAVTKRLNGRARQLMSGSARAKHGSLTTWENAAGETLTIHQTGPLRAGLRETARRALALDPSFRLVSYSTPDTILTDLTGGRADFIRPAPADPVRASYGMANPVTLPEQNVLGQAGLGHLLHPRLVRLSAGSSRPSPGAKAP